MSKSSRRNEWPRNFGPEALAGIKHGILQILLKKRIIGENITIYNIFYVFSSNFLLFITNRNIIWVSGS